MPLQTSLDAPDQIDDVAALTWFSPCLSYVKTHISDS